ncbi:thiamine biosynthesis protein ThiS [Methylohalomonas lacus]|uniref:Thiamine biosynthesis protein ThiS n=1 Tax=Methylohalomonas lacus TaxID=398773 RepID=A0AAE3L1J2_9GAMM|nr:sulfur carrier protein ThiS [Methylohalomonas lacus]MCS3904149.1 thiamine biosynthesis protein ThiS [Methylohalomonas lacus]
MQILVNGETTPLADHSSLADLIRELGLSGRLAVEVNREIVPRSQFERHVLEEGDRVEIVNAIGGG